MNSRNASAPTRARKKTTPPRLYTVSEFAELVGVSRRTVNNWRNRYGRPHVYKLGARVRIPESELEAAADGSMFEGFGGEE